MQPVLESVEGGTPVNLNVDGSFLDGVPGAV